MKRTAIAPGVEPEPFANREQSQTLPLQFELPFGRREATVKEQTVSETEGNAWSAWRQVGRPRSPG